MMQRLPRVVALTLLLLWTTEALARVGGGQSFGGGGGGGGGYSGGGGFGDGDGLLLLIELVIRYPRVGIPLVVLVLVFTAVTKVWESRSGHHVVGTHANTVHGRPRLASRTIPGLDTLQQRDKALSVPVLKDFLALVHRRVLEGAVRREWAPLLPFVDASARKQLEGRMQGVKAIREVVSGGVSLVRVADRGRYTRLIVEFDSTWLEVRDTGESRMRVKERWVFRRRTDATSLTPEANKRLGCPNCGASVETDRLGACSNCETPITAGQLQWQVVEAKVSSRAAFSPPEVGLFAGGDEPSVHMPTLEHPRVAANLRTLQAMHPDFELNEFGERVQGIYHGLQQAWSDNRWADARPWVTDAMYNSLRFWMEQYTDNGLRNQLADVRLTRFGVVKVEVDAWYESITVRIWGSMKDSVVDKTGKVVGGNPKVDRNFSEYWTFIRAVGTGGEVHDANACPSCAAPLDRIGQAGECGYCGSVITTGKFDWVLSGIEQCEAYRGG